jgi:hypothetical protein
MLGSFTKRMDWLERVARDPDCRGLPTAVAVLLAVRYFNSTTGRAWPATATLAEALTADRRSIRRSIDTLVEAGHLERETGGGGRKTNSYWMRWERERTRPERAGADTPSSAEGGSRRPGEGAYTPRERGRRDPPILGNTPGNTRGRPAPPATLLPQDWKQGAAELVTAQRIVGWDPERAKSEFEHFCSHHRAKGTRSRDWAASWEIWCRNGAKFDQGSKRGSSRSALRGLERWLARQPADNSE